MAERAEEDSARREGGDPMRYATDYHAPVLWKAVTEGLITDRKGLYIDATLGGGGHAAALLAALDPEGRVLGIDRDADAIAAAEARLRSEVERGRFRAMRGNFGDLRRLLAAAGERDVSGLLLDLGVSSHQLDTAARGFSYSRTGELDMRMDQRGGVTAAEVVNRWSREELYRLLREYGEEPRAGKIARAVEAARPLASTEALAEAVRSAVPAREEVKSLSRVFQAIRIAVNAELDALESALHAAVALLPEGARMAVISYHSLEDRRVKRFFRYGNLKGEPVRDFYGNLLTPWRELTRKPVSPEEEEIAANPRARSARLRMAERLASEEERGADVEGPPHT